MGFDPACFWTLTPRELAVHMEGAGARLRHEHNARAWLAWHIEALSRTKRLPKLKDLTIQPKANKRPQSWEEQLRIANLWHRAINNKGPLNG